MAICGIEMKGSEAVLVLLDGVKSGFSFVDVKPRKLTLADDEDPGEIKAFHNSLFAFFKENNVTLVAVKKRSKKGEYAGGPINFKLEAIAQLYRDCEIRLVAPQTISADMKKHSPCTPESLRKYQKAAFQVAFCALK